MKTIPLTKGMVALVDDDDFEWLNQWNWSVSSGGGGLMYAARTEGPRRNMRRFAMHRVILEAPKGMEVDHINHNTLDNRRENLRLCERFQNNGNRGVGRHNKSGLKGVNFDRNRWKAEISVKNKTVYLGRFKTKEDAGRAYDVAAINHFGQFARTNSQLGLL